MDQKGWWDMETTQTPPQDQSRAAEGAETYEGGV